MNQLASAKLGIMGWELIIVLFLIGGEFLLGLMLGKNRIFLMLLGAYISSALLSVIPVKKMFPDFFGKEENFVVMIVSFLVLIGIVYIIFSKSVLKSKSRTQSIFQTFFYGLFLVGIILTMVFSFFPKDLISQFSDLTLKIFNTSLARILWFVMPLVFIWIFKKNGK
ncbi:hypothetical protein KKF60_01185 [Patescibacteria group bacterium]|nr:hypothetical protein [Patescibacteria group bacterium]MBU4458498.1 hypothetical protein [Patescibacteria group bacterium]MCG2696366.1 hypothetical protein [Candidatus Portnoybacteria bacterium]